MIDRLQSEYAELEARHTALNSELAAVNSSLREAATANRRLANHLDQIVATVNLGIISVDDAGLVRLFNRTASDLLGIPPCDALNRPYELVCPNRHEDSATALACARGAAPVTNQRRELIVPGETPVILSVSTMCLESGPEGHHGGAIEVFADVTAMEAMHREIARMRTLAALGEMSATIAHEIRNPLGGIIGFAELLARRIDGDKEVRGMLTSILQGAENLNVLVNRLLEFARDPRLERRPLDWNRFLDTTIDQFEDGARRRGAKIKLVRKWPEKLPAANADGLCLRQALWNILENAEQATSGDGEVTLTVAPYSAGQLELSITDDGPGIDPKIVDRLFVPFATTKKKGTGLGLATARKLIEAHGGTIAVESAAGKGTTVRVHLPLKAAEES
jgi:nitrogen-specific signal transduction histidine kinase